MAGVAELDGTMRTAACCAPSRAIYVFPDGQVRSCCVNTVALGNLRNQPLSEIWRGVARRRLVEAIDVDDFTLGCGGCGDEIAREGAIHAYPRQFDVLSPPSSSTGDWPAMMGLYLANTCNLQCVQCEGVYSSSIRKHRERRPPIRTHYDERFFDDLREFLPRLRQLLFAGGEPFLIPEFYRTVEMVEEIAPGLPCTIITNGTQWNQRVAGALERIAASIVVSIDGATAATFESIRVGARFDDVMRNVERFREYVATAGTTLTFNFCLMRSNHHEFADFLQMAEHLGVRVDVSVVREPEFECLGAMDADELESVVAGFRERDDEVSATLDLNAATWRREVDRVGDWLRSAREHRVGSARPSDHTVLMFQRRGLGPVDDASVRAELAAIDGDAWVVHDITVDETERIIETSSSFDTLIGVARGAMVGRSANDVWTAMTDRFGRSTSLDEVGRDDDRSRFRARFPGYDVHGATVALRDASGLASEARILFVMVPTREA